MSSGIIDIIKNVALNTYKASSPVSLLFGKVISTNPVKIQISENLILTQEFLVINGSVSKGDTVSVIRCQGGQKYVVLGTRTSTVENTIYVGGGIDDDSVINRAVTWAINIANDNSHGYSQSHRWGPDYDCSSFVISAFEQAGVPVKSKGGAGYTKTMYAPFIKCGFKDVTSSVSLPTGKGLKKGDVLLNVGRHTALVIEDEGRIVHASINEFGGITGGQKGDQTGREILIEDYFSFNWTYVLRYEG